jgi:3-isopropylmalate dehydrogenase
MQFASNPERYANTVVIADAMFGSFLQTIIDVVTGSAQASEETRTRIAEEGIKRVFIRELCGGLYFGPRDDKDPDFVYDTMEYDAKTIQDLATVARRVNSQLGLDTIDSLEIERIPTFDFWAKVLDDDAGQNGYRLRHYEQRDGVKELMTNPYLLGTLIATNMIGDIYTDLGGAVVGKSLGVLPSSETNADGFGNYQQIAGSAPAIAAKNIANPIAEIRSAAMMLEDFGDVESAKLVNDAVTAALHKVRTEDIWEEGYQKVSTTEMGDFIVQYIKEAQ